MLERASLKNIGREFGRQSTLDQREKAVALAQMHLFGDSQDIFLNSSEFWAAMARDFPDYIPQNASQVYTFRVPYIIRLNNFWNLMRIAIFFKVMDDGQKELPEIQQSASLAQLRSELTLGYSS
ncbi:MAG: hypothetical protein AAB639_01905 [Patescibacteria group bacterium]